MDLAEPAKSTPTPPTGPQLSPPLCDELRPRGIAPDIQSEEAIGLNILSLKYGVEHECGFVAQPTNSSAGGLAREGISEMRESVGSAEMTKQLWQGSCPSSDSDCRVGFDGDFCRRDDLSLPAVRQPDPISDSCC